ncbi:hypothetical protein [Reichenbachiella versicolor]|uniref:hypothetical protein n=1 Tax=Reichenbachiella versicolor TaxID=1821036 RepID=UPI000D6E9DE2|nr:hypothetical protein [Reichenbachiella versicolor]
MKNNTIDAKILNADVAIQNASQNERIKEALALYGYGETKILAMKALLDHVKIKQANQKKEYGDQYDATDALDTARQAANAIYNRHLKIARIALKDHRGAWESLQLKGRRKSTYSGWLEQVSIFYQNISQDEGIATTLLEFGITADAISDMIAKVKDIEVKTGIQKHEMGEAQEATVLRDQALEELLDKMSDFIGIAKIALEEDPQLLEALGIVQRAD